MLSIIASVRLSYLIQILGIFYEISSNIRSLLLLLLIGIVTFLIREQMKKLPQTVTILKEFLKVIIKKIRSNSLKTFPQFQNN